MPRDLGGWVFFMNEVPLLGAFDVQRETCIDRRDNFLHYPYFDKAPWHQRFVSTHAGKDRREEWGYFKVNMGFFKVNGISKSVKS
jgi:hypothetical protein